MKLLQSIFIYALLAAMALFAAACIWEHRVTGVLYRCTDSVPILDFIPPFVHSGGHTGDAYLVSQAQVYHTWYAYLGVSLAVPAVPLLVLLGLHWFRWRKQENGG
jgi:hypothetical protein